MLAAPPRDDQLHPETTGIAPCFGLPRNPNRFLLLSCFVCAACSSRYACAMRSAASHHAKCRSIVATPFRGRTSLASRIARAKFAGLKQIAWRPISKRASPRKICRAMARYPRLPGYESSVFESNVNPIHVRVNKAPNATRAAQLVARRKLRRKRHRTGRGRQSSTVAASRCMQHVCLFAVRAARYMKKA